MHTGHVWRRDKADGDAAVGNVMPRLIDSIGVRWLAACCPTIAMLHVEHKSYSIFLSGWWRTLHVIEHAHASWRHR